MVREPDAQAVLLKALKELRTASRVSDRDIIRFGRHQSPVVHFKAQTLSDWFNGRTVPSDRRNFQFLVDYLQKAARRNSAYQVRSSQWWEELRCRARQERMQSRGNRKAWTAREQSPNQLGDLLFVSEDKIIRRLGISPESDCPRPIPHNLVARAIRKIDQVYHPRNFTDASLQSYEWIRFDLNMNFMTAYEEGGRPPADVALFAGSTSSLDKYSGEETSLLLCGSIKHLRTNSLKVDRMGSDTSWLHRLIVELQDRSDTGVDTVPEFISQILPGRVNPRTLELAARHTFASMRHELASGNLRGYATVLMDIDHSPNRGRLVVASPLYVENCPA